MTTIQINQRGTLTLPKSVRTQLQIKKDDQLWVEVTDKGILLKPVFIAPVEIYTPEQIKRFQSDIEALKKEDQCWVKASETSLKFWDNPEDDVWNDAPRAS